MLNSEEKTDASTTPVGKSHTMAKRHSTIKNGMNQTRYEGLKAFLIYSIAEEKNFYT